MCAFSTTTLAPTILDPRKRVRYATGLVLGVDEFQQDQTYLMERDRRHQRALHGYGTASGLDVRARLRDGEPEVIITPGLAVDPQGRDVCVPAAQCALLNAWLAEHAEEVGGPGSFPDETELYVLLCYRECETDLVPVPGSPCRSEDDASAPSRVADAFELRLSTEAPAYAEEEAVRRFGRLLRRLRVSDEGPATTRAELGDLVRALPDGEAPGGDAPLHLPPDEAAALVRYAFRVWTVEVRPLLEGEGGCAVPADACVVLARLDLALAPNGDGVRVDDTAAPGDGGVPGVRVRQEDRPYLVSTRVLQEWLAHGGAGEGPGSFPDDQVLLALNDLIDVEAAPGDGDVLTWDAGSASWVSAPPSGGGDGGGGVTDHGVLSGLGDDDHPQYFDEARGDTRYAALAHTHAFPDLDALEAGGDLTGLYPFPSVAGLQGRAVSPALPGTGQVLQWTGTEWAPATLVLPEPERGIAEENLVRITGLNWPHGGTALPRVTLDGEEVPGLVLGFGFGELGDGGEARVGEGSLDPRSFEVFLETPFAESEDFYTYVGVRPVDAEIVPVRVLSTSGSAWEVERVSGGRQVRAGAALFRLPPQVAEVALGARLRVVVHGDVVRDGEGSRAIDAEHVGGALPTGDRPERSARGVRGGRFESWFVLGDRRGGGPRERFGFERLLTPRAPERPEPEPPAPGGLVDLNRATRDELRTLPGVGAATADRILAARGRGERFRSADDLTRLAGVPERTAAALRDRLRFDG